MFSIRHSLNVYIWQRPQLIQGWLVNGHVNQNVQHMQFVFVDWP